jgi:hypothetical protein
LFDNTSAAVGTTTAAAKLSASDVSRIQSADLSRRKSEAAPSTHFRQVEVQPSSYIPRSAATSVPPGVSAHLSRVPCAASGDKAF